MDQNCKGCKFVHAHGETLICRRYPPTVQYLVVPKTNMLAGGIAPTEEQRHSYPRVLPTWWCGEYSPFLAKMQ